MKKQEPTLFEFEHMEFEKAGEKVSTRMISGREIAFSNSHFEKGCRLPMHRHENEQITYVLTGCLKGTAGEKNYTLKPGQAVLIPSFLPHEWEALEDTTTLDIFSPPREKPTFDRFA